MLRQASTAAARVAFRSFQAAPAASRALLGTDAGAAGDAVPTVHVHGATGRLGSLICALPGTEAVQHRATGPLPVADMEVVVDTSLPAGLESLLSRLRDGGAQEAAAALPTVVVGTTGNLPVEAIEAYAQHAPVYICPNFSTGIRLLMPTLKTLGANPRYTSAVTEIHHTKKLDAPSGTAVILAGALQTDQVASVRAADVKGIHRMDIIGEFEAIEITHTANDRGMFATGALELAQELAAKRASGELVNGIHDPFGMLSSDVAGVVRTAPEAVPEGDDGRTARQVSDVPALTLSPPPALHLKPSVDTERIQELRLMTAIKTPYDRYGRIDLDAFDAHVEHQIEHGVEGLIIGGTTGEGHLFNWGEHIMLIAHTKNKFGDRVVVVGNTGSNCTGEVNANTAYGFASGMDAALIINPYYGRTSPKGIVSHLNAGLKHGPSIVYNVPGRTGQDIKPEVMYQLAEHPHFAGIKECEGPARIREYVDAGLTVWSGNDDDMHFCRHVLGAQGSISVAANVVPGLYQELLFGERNDALNETLGPLFKWLFMEPNPIGVNTLLSQLGVCEPNFRLPYHALERDMREEAVRIVEAIGAEHVINGDQIRVMDDDEFNHLAAY